MCELQNVKTRSNYLEKLVQGLTVLYPISFYASPRYNGGLHIFRLWHYNLRFNKCNIYEQNQQYANESYLKNGTTQATAEIYIYIYIYVCVCVFVCARVRAC